MGGEHEGDEVKTIGAKRNFCLDCSHIVIRRIRYTDETISACLACTPFGINCVRRQENGISNLGDSVHRVIFNKFSFNRSSAFITIFNLCHTCIDISYAQTLTIAHLIIVCSYELVSFPFLLHCFQSDCRTHFNYPRLLINN